MLQTDNTGMCSQCLGHTGFVPAYGVCAFPPSKDSLSSSSHGQCPALGHLDLCLAPAHTSHLALSALSDSFLLQGRCLEVLLFLN